MEVIRQNLEPDLDPDPARTLDKICGPDPDPTRTRPRDFVAGTRAQIKLHPYHPGWKTIPNLGDTLGQKQCENRLADTTRLADRQTDQPTDT